MQNYGSDQEELISLCDICKIIKKYFIFLCVYTLLGGFLAFLYLAFINDENYASEAIIMVNGQHQSIKDFMTSEPILFEVIGELDIEPDIEEIRDALTFNINTSSAYIYLSYESETSGQGMMILNKILEISLENAQENPTYALYKDKITIISEVTKEEVIQPNNYLIIAIGLILGGIVSLGIVFVKETIFSTIQSKTSCETLLEIDCLGVITSCGHKKILSDEKKLQAMQHVMDNLMLLNLDHWLKTMLLIPMMKEKSEVHFAITLASLLASKNKKVLLLDFDFKHPVLSVALNPKNTLGIHDYLISDLNINDIISHDENLHFDYVMTGNDMDVTTHILHTTKFKQMIDHLKEDYEQIIIIAPTIDEPKNIEAILPICDGSLLIISSKYSKKTESINAMKFLHEKKVNIIGGVLVDCKSKETFLGIPLIKS